MARVRNHLDGIKESATAYVIAYADTIYPNNTIELHNGAQVLKTMLHEWIRDYMDEWMEDVLPYCDINLLQTFPADGKPKRKLERIEYQMIDAITDAITIINEEDWDTAAAQTS